MQSGSSAKLKIGQATNIILVSRTAYVITAFLCKGRHLCDQCRKSNRSYSFCAFTSNCQSEIAELEAASISIAGVFNFRDVSVPVIDLCFLLKNSHCNNHFSTRIVLIEYLMDKGNKHVLGMLAEQVTETFKSDANDMISSGVTIKNAPYLEKVVLQDKEVIQFIDVKNLLPKSVQSMLFR